MGNTVIYQGTTGQSEGVDSGDTLGWDAAIILTQALSKILG